jgi:pimeloyl-ACP methyl ester carboxylesterase
MDAREQLVQFRATHEMRRLAIAGHEWTCISGGAGPRTLALLPGGGGSAECAFPLMLALESRYRVLSIGCPPTVTTVAEVLSGMEGLLEMLGARSCAFLGHSLGGLFAECFMATRPAAVEALIFANAANYSPLRQKLLAPVLGLAGRLPGRLLAAQMRAQLTRLLKSHPEREFWLAYYTGEELALLGEEGVVNRVRCLRDFIAHWYISPDQVARWGGPVLILEASDETGFTKGEREALQRLYPQARVHTLVAAGHLSFLYRPDEFVTAVVDFLDGSGVSAAPTRVAGVSKGECHA